MASVARRIERSFGRFERSVRVPPGLDPDLLRIGDLSAVDLKRALAIAAEVLMDVPGLRADALDIELENDILAIRGVRPFRSRTAATPREQLTAGAGRPSPGRPSPSQSRTRIRSGQLFGAA